MAIPAAAAVRTTARDVALVGTALAASLMPMDVVGGADARGNARVPTAASEGPVADVSVETAKVSGFDRASATARTVRPDASPVGFLTPRPTGASGAPMAGAHVGRRADACAIPTTVTGYDADGKDVARIARAAP